LAWKALFPSSRCETEGADAGVPPAGVSAATTGRFAIRSATRKVEAGIRVLKEAVMKIPRHGLLARSNVAWGCCEPIRKQLQEYFHDVAGGVSANAFIFQPRI
jgi:hypothetical protein